MDARNVPPEFDDIVMWAAWLYYSDQMTQNEIASRLKVSRATVINYLQEARERGLVIIQISPEANARTSVARALMAKFGLDGASVIPPNDSSFLIKRLGAAGAQVLADRVQSGDTIGVAWGRTVLAVADQIALAQPQPDLMVVQVAGSLISEPDFSPELCTTLLASRIGARCINLLAPAILSTGEIKRLLLAEPILRRQFELIHGTNHILFGAGDVGPRSTIRAAGILSDAELQSYLDGGAVAVIIGRFLDAQGRPVRGEPDQRMVGITLEDLRQIPSRICVGGGEAKVPALRATLTGGYATHLVTDLATAEALLDT